jgi:hypothetical protein
LRGKHVPYEVFLVENQREMWAPFISPIFLTQSLWVSSSSRKSASQGNKRETKLAGILKFIRKLSPPNDASFFFLEAVQPVVSRYTDRAIPAYGILDNYRRWSESARITTLRVCFLTR